MCLEDLCLENPATHHGSLIDCPLWTAQASARHHFKPTSGTPFL